MERELVIEKEFDYRGYHCVITFRNFGFRCGYVGIPVGHMLYRKNYDWEMPIYCHGGVTYAGDKHPKDDGYWYYGFDCAHAGDGTDYDGIRKHFGEEEEKRMHEFDEMYCEYDGYEKLVWSEQMVERELQRMVDSIIKNYDEPYEEDKRECVQKLYEAVKVSRAFFDCLVSMTYEEDEYGEKVVVLFQYRDGSKRTIDINVTADSCAALIEDVWRVLYKEI